MAARVSIVVPTFNNAQFVAATLKSALAQTYRDCEIVVADHSSSDETQSVIESFASDPRIRVLSRTPMGGGAKANWNRVTEAATGEFVKLVCGDDTIDPNAVEEQVAAFDSHPGIVMVACRRRLIDARGRVLLAGRGLGGASGRKAGRDWIRASVRAGTNIFGEPACVLLKRQTLQQIGGWDSEFPYLIDQSTYTKALLLGDAVGLDMTLASFRISGTQWSVRLARQQARQAIAFHRTLAVRNPGLLRGVDVYAGNAMARVNAWLRRGAYLWLGSRMRPVARKSVRDAQPGKDAS